MVAVPSTQHFLFPSLRWTLPVSGATPSSPRPGPPVLPTCPLATCRDGMETAILRLPRAAHVPTCPHSAAEHSRWPVLPGARRGPWGVRRWGCLSGTPGGQAELVSTSRRRPLSGDEPAGRGLGKGQSDPLNGQRPGVRSSQEARQTQRRGGSESPRGLEPSSPSSRPVLPPLREDRGSSAQGHRDLLQHPRPDGPRRPRLD